MSSFSYGSEALHVVTISGGGGGNALGAALAPYAPEFGSLTSIVTPFDNGGSSGVLRTALGVPAVGDLRNVLGGYIDPDAATVLERRAEIDVDHESIVQLHPLGNIVLAHMMAGRRPTFDAYRELGIDSDYIDVAEELATIAIRQEGLGSRQASKEYLAAFGAATLNVEATMLSDTPGELVAVWEGGVIVGESLIGKANFEGVVPSLSIQAISSSREPGLEKGILGDIQRADAVIIAAGSANTSVGQALAHSGLRKAVEDADKLIVIGNVIDGDVVEPNHGLYIQRITDVLNGRRPDVFIANYGMTGDLMTDQHLIIGGTEAIERVVAGDIVKLTTPGKDNDQRFGVVHDPSKLGPLVIESLKTPRLTGRISATFKSVVR